MKSSQTLAKLVAVVNKGEVSQAAEIISQLHRPALTTKELRLLEQIEARLLRKKDHLKLLSEQPPAIYKKGYSLVSACMNRNANLLKSLRSWLALAVDEIIIVDWSSDTPVSETLRQARISDSRIRILRVDDETKWVLSYAFNVGFNFVQYDKTIKLDADIVTDTNFLTENHFNKQELVRGYWKTAIDNNTRDQMYINGSFGCYSTHLRTIGFYNEVIQTYGWDDSDLYTRLTEHCGLVTKFLSISSVLHLHQLEEQRTAQQSISESWFIGRVRPTIYSNQYNRILSQITSQHTPISAQDYTVKLSSANSTLLRRTTKNFEPQDWVQAAAKRFTAVYFLTQHFLAICNQTSDGTGALADWANSCFHHNLNFDLGLKLALTDDANTLNEVDLYQAHPKSLKQHIKHTNASYLILHSDEQLILNCHGVLIVALDDAAINKLKAARSSLQRQDLCELTKIPAAEISAASSEARIYIHAQHGLGNRLRAIASAASIAAAEERILSIIWERDMHCDCEFSDLFEYEGEVLTQMPSKFPNAIKQFNYMPNEEGSRKDELITCSPKEDLLVKSAFSLNHPSASYESDNQFLRSLTPAAKVAELIQSVEVDNCIGVHIRMEGASGTQLKSYDSSENWLTKDHEAIQYWRDRSHYSHFVEKIKDLLKADDTLGIFLATDLPETYQAMKNEFPELKMLNRESYDRSAEQLQFALADLLLLANCQVFLGSTWSSFSEIAKRLSCGYRLCLMSEDFSLGD